MSRPRRRTHLLRHCWARRRADSADAAWWEEWCQVQIEYMLLLYWWRRLDEMAERIARVQPLIERHGTPAQQAALFSNLSRQISRANCFAPSDAALAYARAALRASSRRSALISARRFSLDWVSTSSGMAT